MEVSKSRPAASVVANLSDLENFILSDPEACALYKQFLGSQSLDGRKAHHIDFFLDFSRMEEKEWALMHVTKSFSKAQEQFKKELERMHEKYFLEGPWKLDISQEIVDKVSSNLQIRITLLAFKPAIQVVVRDLVFVHFERYLLILTSSHFYIYIPFISFIQSPAFIEFKGIPTSPIFTLFPPYIKQEDIRKNITFGKNKSCQRRLSGIDPKITSNGVENKLSDCLFISYCRSEA